MECKDAEGVQKFITVPATMNWTDLLQKLKHKYGRAVTFMYEADGHSYTVNDERDFKQCWDSAEEAFLRTNPVTPSAHLEAFIINIDPSKILASAGRTGGLRAGRKSHLAPKRVTLGEIKDERVSQQEGAARREAQRQEFDSKHQWIDDMLRKTGAGDSEPSSMRKKDWERLQKECQTLDSRKEKQLSQENFKRALLKSVSTLSQDQISWYVKDAEQNSAQNSAGEILYEKYCELKKTGKSIKEEHGTQDETIRQFEVQISQAFKSRYKTLQAAFKRIDEDKDGFIYKKDFRDLIENKLKIKVAPKALEAIFTRCDSKHDDKLDYEEFLDYFRAVPESLQAGADNLDEKTNEQLCQLLIQTFGSIGQMFEELDTDGNGQVNREEFSAGLQKAGIRLSPNRVKDLLNDMTGEGHNVVDYRKFLQQASKLALSDLYGTGVDEVSKEEARARDKIREFYPDAKQAFHAFNKQKDGRLSQEEFFKGLDAVFGDRHKLPLATKNRLMQVGLARER